MASENGIYRLYARAHAHIDERLAAGEITEAQARREHELAEADLHNELASL
jgi:uncharacterized membrane protein